MTDHLHRTCSCDLRTDQGADKRHGESLNSHCWLRRYVHLLSIESCPICQNCEVTEETASTCSVHTKCRGNFRIHNSLSRRTLTTQLGPSKFLYKGNWETRRDDKYGIDQCSVKSGENGLSRLLDGFRPTKTYYYNYRCVRIWICGDRQIISQKVRLSPFAALCQSFLIRGALVR